MKNLQVIIFLVMLTALMWAQPHSPRARMEPSTVMYKIHEPATSWDKFYRHNGMMHLNFGSRYMGSSMAYLTRGGNSQFLYGMNLDIISVATTNELTTQYLNSSISETALLIPFWFTLKVRLTNNPSNKITPYAITGIGPILGLRFDHGHSFINSLTHLRSGFGGGGFIGIGADYLWSAKWAFSADIRYNVIRLDEPLGINDNYDGLSFFVGFVRAFGQ